MQSLFERKKKNVLTEEARKQLVALYAKGGISQADIAKQFNIAPLTAYRILSKHGATKWEEKKEANKKKVRACCRERAYTVDELAIALDLAAVTIRSILKQLPMYRFRKFGKNEPYRYTIEKRHVDLGSVWLNQI